MSIFNTLSIFMWSALIIMYLFVFAYMLEGMFTRSYRFLSKGRSLKVKIVIWIGLGLLTLAIIVFVVLLVIGLFMPLTYPWS